MIQPTVSRQLIIPPMVAKIAKTIKGMVIKEGLLQNVLFCGSSKF
jgi:hypothetical protein